MKRISAFLFFAIFFWLEAAHGQRPDSTIILPSPRPAQPDLILDTLSAAEDSLGRPVIVNDSISPKKKGPLKRLTADYPNPNKALFLALAIPGGGQMYNKRWWKLPLVYGAYAGMIMAIDYNTNNYKRFRDAYILALNGKPHEFSNTRLNAGDLKRIRDGFDKNRQLSYIGVVAVHMVQAAEAFVDCHLKTFDVSDDLGAVLKPSFGALAVTGEPYLGLGLVFKLN